MTATTSSPAARAAGRGGADVIRLRSRTGDDNIGFFGGGVGDGILESTYFVATETETRQVVALDKDSGTLESSR